jgi:hypothetical protein
MMGILMPETCWGTKTAYFVASSWFFTFTMSTMHGHMNIKFAKCRSENQKSNWLEALDVDERLIPIVLTLKNNAVFCPPIVTLCLARI